MTSNNELFHHGVKGMKWGVRRYQNKDGTLTAKGKKRYVKDEKKVNADANLAKMHNEVRRLAGNQSNLLTGIKGEESTVASLDRLYTRSYFSVLSDIKRYERRSKKLIERYGEKNIFDLASKEYNENAAIMNNIKELYGYKKP